MKLLLAIQGVYYAVTGIWPILDINSFQVVTGGKTDLWLVRTVGWLIAVSGAAFFLESRRKLFSPNLIALAIAQAVVLTGVDIYYSLNGTISRIYLLDALAEISLIVAWCCLYTCDRFKFQQYSATDSSFGHTAAQFE